MGKFKLCPSCGTHNPPTVFECLECETDLTSVRAVDSETVKAETEKPQHVQMSGRVFRVCGCGVKNLPSARKCTGCGEDISDIVPMPETEEKTGFFLVSDDGAYTFEVTENVVVGREQAMNEYLSPKIYVSRSHAELVKDGEKLFIRNLSKANGTYVNNNKLDDELHELKSGDTVSFGGCSVGGSKQSNAAYFTVRVGQCT